MKKCKLCQQPKKLLKKSHIIPDFFYRQSGIYNQKHKAGKIEVNGLTKALNTTYVSSGEYDKDILCEDCDNRIISDLETYGRKVFYGGLKSNEVITTTNFRNPNDGFQYTKAGNVDYVKFKLFLLSILWRSVVSKRDIFKNVSIPAKDEANIREMILLNKPGRVNEYPILTLSYIKDKTAPEDIICEPIKSNIPGKTMISFLICGYVFIFHINDNFPDVSKIKELTITPEKNWMKLHIPKGKTIDFILQFINIKKTW